MKLRMPKWDPLITGFVLIEFVSICLFIYFFLEKKS